MKWWHQQLQGHFPDGLADRVPITESNSLRQLSTQEMLLHARRANRKYAAKKTAQALFKRKNTLETAALFGSAGFVFTNEVSNIITNTYEGVKNWIIETFW